ncbi:24681_t:CDS:2, partial [Gigaspora margarita]
DIYLGQNTIKILLPYACWIGFWTFGPDSNFRTGLKLDLNQVKIRPQS